MARCPKCGSTNIDQYRMPYGPIWCCYCGFTVEDKMANPNPFLEATDLELPDTSENEKTSGESWASALNELSKSRKRQRSVKQSGKKKRRNKDSKQPDNE